MEARSLGNDVSSLVAEREVITFVRSPFDFGGIFLGLRGGWSSNRSSFFIRWIRKGTSRETRKRELAVSNRPARLSFNRSKKRPIGAPPAGRRQFSANSFAIRNGRPAKKFFQNDFTSFSGLFSRFVVPHRVRNDPASVSR